MQFDASPTDHLQAPVITTPCEQVTRLQNQVKLLLADRKEYLAERGSFLQQIAALQEEKRQAEVRERQAVEERDQAVDAYDRLLAKKVGDNVEAEYESGGRPSPEQEQERAARQQLA